MLHIFIGANALRNEAGIINGASPQKVISLFLYRG